MAESRLRNILINIHPLITNPIGLRDLDLGNWTKWIGVFCPISRQNWLVRHWTSGLQVRLAARNAMQSHWNG